MCVVWPRQKVGRSLAHRTWLRDAAALPSETISVHVADERESVFEFVRAVLS